MVSFPSHLKKLGSIIVNHPPLEGKCYGSILRCWLVDFFTRFTQEKTQQNNFSSQNFSVLYLSFVCTQWENTIGSNSNYIPDELTTFFFQFLLTNYAFKPPNHKTLFDFTLPCLWNVQIQLQFWCWFKIWIWTFHRHNRVKWSSFLWLGD